MVSVADLRNARGSDIKNSAELVPIDLMSRLNWGYKNCSEFCSRKFAILSQTTSTTLFLLFHFAKAWTEDNGAMAKTLLQAQR